jgi:ParB family chromosome partitioning protein
MAALQELALDDILVTDRHRTDLGDIASLATSMKEIGQLQAVVVTTEKRLIAGERRLAAARSLGWAKVEVKVVSNLADVGMLLRAEAEENTCRKAFTPTEAESIARAREEWLAPLAEAAKAHGQTAPGKPQNAGAKLAPASPAAPDRKTRAIAANGTGYSPSTIAKVRAVKEVAADESKPEPVRQVAREALTNMDRSGKVDGEHKRVKIAEQAAESKQVMDYVNADKELQLHRWNANFFKAVCRITEVTPFTAEVVAEKADQQNLDELRQAVARINQYLARVEELLPKGGLRIVNGDCR